MVEPDSPVSTAGISAATPDPGAAQPALGEERRNVERLFLEYYGMNEQPFGVTPDPRFLYLGPKHQQALDVLNYGTELNRGFLTLIAKPGMGKTSLLFHYLEGLRNNARTAFVFQTDGDSVDLMRYLLTDLGLDSAGKTLPEMRTLLSQVLMAEMKAGRRFVLIIDEAQNLDERVLESVRLLSNFETPWMKLIQIVLAGQPELTERLATPSMTQFRQRVSFGIRIDPLTHQEVQDYVNHRLSIAGYDGPPLFSAGAMRMLAEYSEGIPRNVNNICFCAMSYRWAMKAIIINEEMMRDVLVDLDLETSNEKQILTVKPTREQSIPTNARPKTLTFPATTARSWPAKVAVFGAFLFALGYFGIGANMTRRAGFSWQTILPSQNKPGMQTPAAGAMISRTTAIPGDSLEGAKGEVPSGGKDLGAPKPDDPGSLSSIQEHK